MSAARARRALDVTGASDSTMMEPPNLDVVLEIIARSDDAATVARCPAASKSLRRAILDPDFRRLLELRSAANGAFDPALLVAVSYRLREYRHGTHTDTVVVLPSRRLRFDTDLLRSFEPASSRNGLLVLRRTRNQEGPGIELRVYNTVTGHVTSRPSMNVGLDGDTRKIFPPALLPIDDAGCSFELLVLYALYDPHHGQRLETHTVSSQEAKWSAECCP
ncbi:hypothetical protein BAE44_0025171 [Dichanthelium oligosanthes]|uniref:DUF7595 domain-containing protein n=1 Tax=Dichanthelium oligosanthes TaxID=888268 RepID=A0A1E5ULQ5_9POAL|nr:hypothetical protein BAE44_0025171 [Dichanthelium oligosanthes]